MKSINSLKEFVDWSKEVNLCPQSTKRWCDLQDIFAHSNIEHLIDWYVSKEALPDRRLLLFAVYKNQGDDHFVKFVNAQAREFAQGAIEKWEAEYDKEYAIKLDELRKQKHDLDDAKTYLTAWIQNERRWRKSAYKKIRELEAKVEYFKVLYNGAEVHIRKLEYELELKKRRQIRKPKRMITV